MESELRSSQLQLSTSQAQVAELETRTNVYEETLHQSQQRIQQLSSEKSELEETSNDSIAKWKVKLEQSVEALNTSKQSVQVLEERMQSENEVHQPLYIHLYMGFKILSTLYISSSPFS
jgi:DNA repair ATPase RecN